MNKNKLDLISEPFSQELISNELSFNDKINKLTNLHYKKSKNYKKILDIFDYSPKKDYSTQDLPFIPVRLFKEMDLMSISDKDVYKVLKSSGTSSGTPSKIFLDKENAINQTNILNKIMSHYLGKQRLPMLFIDKNPKLVNRKSYNARVAAISGFSIFGKNHTFLLNEDNEIDYKALNIFLNKFSSSNFLVFGFTSFIYEQLLLKLDLKKINKNFSNAILLHGGGWKKLQNLNIDNKKFKNDLSKKIKITRIHNYYGLIEQTGSIFIECKCGYFIPSVYSDIIIRDKDFNVLDNNKRGFVQLLSLLPSSYPGHNILTEDIGELVDQHNCNCKYNGKRFVIHGRVQEAETRGCSDV